MHSTVMYAVEYAMLQCMHCSIVTLSLVFINLITHMCVCLNLCVRCQFFS